MRAWESNNTKSVQAFDSTKSIHIPDTDEYNFNFWTAAPVLSNGFVFMGEADTKWVAVSQDRFSEMVVYPDMFYITAEGYPGEEITMLYIEPDQLTPSRSSAHSPRAVRQDSSLEQWWCMYGNVRRNGNVCVLLLLLLLLKKSMH